MLIVFVTKGGIEMGMGHIYRTLTLASELGTKSYVSYVTSDDDEIVNKQIEEAGFRVFTITSDYELKYRLSQLKPDVIVFDRLNIEELLARDVKSITNSKLVLFENSTAANNHASIVVNAVTDSYLKNTRYLNEKTQTLHFCGPKYWILRKEFYEYKGRKKIPGPGIKKIAMAFGASDPSNLSSKALDELLKSDREFQIDLCLGIHFVYFQELNEVLNKYPEKSRSINLHFNMKMMAELMFNSDLVITSPGTCAFEALSVGTPIIAVSQNVNQDIAYKGYLRTIDKHQLVEIKDFIDRKIFISPNQKEIVEAEIGEGKEEVLHSIINLASGLGITS